MHVPMSGKLCYFTKAQVAIVNNLEKSHCLKNMLLSCLCKRSY